MSLEDGTPIGRPTSGQPRNLGGAVWLALFAGIAVWAAARLGAFHLWQSVAAPDGSSGRFPVGFATVDHPFHAVRGELLRRSVVEGHPLRWIVSHQGGYPTEFYPLGAAALDVAVWFLAFGALPMIAVHKLVVIAVFLLPGLAFARTVKADRLTYGVALLA
ncbi:MAG: hypothetical protein ACR2OO_16700, partial [Thermomicrobiales bacterium]